MTIPADFQRLSLTALGAAERQALLRALEAGEPARGLRLRPGVPLDTVRQALPGPYAPVPWARDAHYVEALSPVGGHPLHAAGAYYLQEPSAMAAVSALDVRPGQRVLDLCAAPGGKATQIAAGLAGAGVLVANEVIPGRAKVLAQNVERLGVTNAIVTWETPERLAEAWGPWFDRVLVDAPCSGEGMFRREPGTARQWSPGALAGCAARQLRILGSAAALLRPGGLLVYSTCTFNETENEGVVSAFLAGRPDFAAETFALPVAGSSVDGRLRLWPHLVLGEGHFVARLRREGSADPGAWGVTEAPPSKADLAARLREAQAAGPGREGGPRWMIPSPSPDLSGIRALRPGLPLGEWTGETFLPHHALAMALSPAAFPHILALDDGAASRYLRGETLEAPGVPPGWALAAYRGLSLGWGKCVEGALKNRLPKGLRRA